jgi:excisionase family DNA binding protein
MDEFLARADLRTFLKRSMSTVERLLRQRAFPVVKVGHKVLVRRAAVQHWLTTREIPAQSPPETPPPIDWPVRCRGLLGRDPTMRRRHDQGHP